MALGLLKRAALPTASTLPAAPAMPATVVTAPVDTRDGADGVVVDVGDVQRAGAVAGEPFGLAKARGRDVAVVEAGLAERAGVGGDGGARRVERANGVVLGVADVDAPGVEGDAARLIELRRGADAVDRTDHAVAAGERRHRRGRFVDGADDRAVDEVERAGAVAGEGPRIGEVHRRADAVDRAVAAGLAGDEIERRQRRRHA